MDDIHNKHPTPPCSATTTGTAVNSCEGYPAYNGHRAPRFQHPQAATIPSAPSFWSLCPPLTRFCGGAWPRDAAADMQASRQAKHCTRKCILIEESVVGSLPL